MAAKIVNLANPDENETLCATVEEARETLAAMVERSRFSALHGRESSSTVNVRLWPFSARHDIVF